MLILRVPPQSVVRINDTFENNFETKIPSSPSVDYLAEVLVYPIIDIMYISIIYSGML